MTSEREAKEKSKNRNKMGAEGFKKTEKLGVDKLKSSFLNFKKVGGIMLIVQQQANYITHFI